MAGRYMGQVLTAVGQRFAARITACPRVSQGLYFAGGTAHPGGGVPEVIALSGR